MVRPWRVEAGVPGAVATRSISPLSMIRPGPGPARETRCRLPTHGSAQSSRPGPQGRIRVVNRWQLRGKGDYVEAGPAMVTLAQNSDFRCCPGYGRRGGVQPD